MKNHYGHGILCLPWIAAGNVSCWILVGFLKPSSMRAFTIGSWSLNSAHVSISSGVKSDDWVFSSPNLGFFSLLFTFSGFFFVCGSGLLSLTNFLLSLFFFLRSFLLFLSLLFGSSLFSGLLFLLDISLVWDGVVELINDSTTNPFTIFGLLGFWFCLILLCALLFVGLFSFDIGLGLTFLLGTSLYSDSTGPLRFFSGVFCNY